MAKYYDRCWNPIFGCNGCFTGCDRCYAKSLMERRNREWSDFTRMKINKKQLYRPFDAEPKLMSVCTQSDLFQGKANADQWIVDTVLAKCNANRQNRYLFLTKFSDNLKKYMDDAMPRIEGRHLQKFSFDNMAFGVSVCCKDDLHRLDDLRSTRNIQHRFVAFEPLLEDIGIEEHDLDGIEWVIAGAQTGDNPMPCRTEWLKGIVRIATIKGLPVFVNAVHTDEGKVTTEFDEMDEELRRCENPYRIL